MFCIIQWLWASQTLNSLMFCIIQWLWASETLKSLMFCIIQWLRASQTLKSLMFCIIQWLRASQTLNSLMFCIIQWLRASQTLIKSLMFCIIQWLRASQTLKSLMFCIIQWLRASQTLKSLMFCIIQWLPASQTLIKSLMFCIIQWLQASQTLKSLMFCIIPSGFTDIKKPNVLHHPVQAKICISILNFLQRLTARIDKSSHLHVWCRHHSSSSSGFDEHAGVGASSTSVGHSPGNWLAAHRADLNLGKTAICTFVAKFYGSMPFLSPTQTLSAVQELRLYPTDLGYVLNLWHHESAEPLLPHLEVELLSPAVKLLSPRLWQASFWHSCHFVNANDHAQYFNTI